MEMKKKEKKKAKSQKNQPPQSQPIYVTKVVTKQGKKGKSQ